MLDLLFTNAKIIDGTGKEAYIGSLGVENGVQKLNVSADTEAKRVIDAKGRYLAPGFIDAHSHGDLTFHKDFSMRAKLGMGVTTQVAGQCGESIFPCSKKYLDEYHDVCTFAIDKAPKEWEDFSSMAPFLAALERTPIALNMAEFIGHNSLRAAVMGFENREPTAAELDEMCALVDEAMRNGALGLSSGLMYMPGCFSKFDEMKALVEVVQKYNGIYVTHMRDEADRVTESVRETLDIARATGVHVWISHHKVSGLANWGRSVETLKLVDEAVKEGLNVTLDQYPFPASMTGLDACFPPMYTMVGAKKLIEQMKDPAFRSVLREQMQIKSDYESTFLNAGSFHRIQVSGSEKEPAAEGLRIDDYAAKLGKDPFDVLFDLYSVNNGVINGVYYTMNEDDVMRIFMNENTVVGSDGITRTETEKTHPRAFATFPQAINFFVREKKLLSLEACVRKMTGQTAEAFGFSKKGRIGEGLDADLVLFDYDLLKNCATFDEPSRRCDGIQNVVVAGEMAYENGEMTAARAGKFLPRE